jgi:hypothetical protein
MPKGLLRLVVENLYVYLLPIVKYVDDTARLFSTLGKSLFVKHVIFYLLFPFTRKLKE